MTEGAKSGIKSDGTIFGIASVKASGVIVMPVTSGAGAEELYPPRLLNDRPDSARLSCGAGSCSSYSLAFGKL